ncbi:uncharacterized protein L201_005433 [Kwoniella dendrophila CBS 6074]|uniref:Uncharacterized protein n=1 Tax=Kwoniella dendrophila CBS 6074 TaxID=1295534 RepID=A0AAX4JYS7_9TREE
MRYKFTNPKANKKSDKPEVSKSKEKKSRIFYSPFVFSSSSINLLKTNLIWLKTGNVNETDYLKEFDLTRYTRTEDKVLRLNLESSEHEDNNNDDQEHSASIMNPRFDYHMNNGKKMEVDIVDFTLSD